MHRPNGVQMDVQSDAEKEAALADGWALWPVPDAPDPPIPDPAAASLESVTEKRKPGRQKKAAV